MLRLSNDGRAQQQQSMDKVIILAELPVGSVYEMKSPAQGYE